MVKPKKYLLPAAVAALLLSLPVYSEEQSRLIVPVNKTNAAQQDKEQTEKNRYHFQPVGYTARKQDRRSNQGRLLYARFACAQCHAVKGEGGEIGPPLDGIGGHRGREWLTARVLEPEKQNADFPDMFGNKPSMMPHKVQKLKEAELLSDYLLTLEEPKEGFSVARHSAGEVETDIEQNGTTFSPLQETDASRSGRELFSDLHCAACHSLDGTNDRFGPDLAGIGERLTDKKLEKILTGAVRSLVMKKQARNLGEEQVYDLKAFLLTVPKADSKKTSPAIK
jgi:cytochrome c553